MLEYLKGFVTTTVHVLLVAVISAIGVGLFVGVTCRVAILVAKW